MKKYIFLLLSMIVSLALNAQDSHLKFMGIPLDGKINVFHKEMKKKGFKLDPLLGKYFQSSGTNYYNGVFAGNDAIVFIYFDTKTKTVYQAKVVIDCFSKDVVLDIYNDIVDLVEQKYSQNEGVQYCIDLFNKATQIDEKAKPFDWIITMVDEDGFENKLFVIPCKDDMSYIRVFPKKSNAVSTGREIYSLFIIYNDGANEKLNTNSQLDDL